MMKSDGAGASVYIPGPPIPAYVVSLAPTTYTSRAVQVYLVWASLSGVRDPRVLMPKL